MESSCTLAPEQLRALGELSRVPELGRFYLAGGSAVAAHLNHRRSVDLDLFSRDESVDLARLGRRLIPLLGSAEVVSLTDVTLTLRCGDLAIDLVAYPYPLLEEPGPGPGGFPLAGLRDLAAMKLSAIAKRGIFRDFWDLHEIVTKTPVDLTAACQAYLSRFGVAESDLYHVLRSLTYFEDAEREAIFPMGLSPKHWLRISDFFRAQAPSLIR